MPSSVRASSATSSSAAGWGTPREGSRVRAISSAVVVSWAIGAIARRAIIIAGEQREARSGQYAEQQEQLDARDGGLGVGDRWPYWMTIRPIGSSVPSMRTAAAWLSTR